MHTLVQLILVELTGLTSTSHLSDLRYTIKHEHTTRDITSTDLTGKPTLLVLLFYLFLSFAPRENIQDLVPKIFLLFRMLSCLVTPEFPDLRADIESTPSHSKLKPCLTRSLRPFSDAGFDPAGRVSGPSRTSRICAIYCN